MKLKLNTVCTRTHTHTHTHTHKNRHDNFSSSLFPISYVNEKMNRAFQVTALSEMRNAMVQCKDHIGGADSGKSWGLSMFNQSNFQRTKLKDKHNPSSPLSTPLARQTSHAVSCFKVRHSWMVSMAGCGPDRWTSCFSSSTFSCKTLETQASCYKFCREWYLITIHPIIGVDTKQRKQLFFFYEWSCDGQWTLYQLPLILLSFVYKQ